MPVGSAAASARERVLAAVEELAPTYVELLGRLLRAPSELGGEREAQRLMAAQMRRIGLLVDVFD